MEKHTCHKIFIDGQWVATGRPLSPFEMEIATSKATINFEYPFTKMSCKFKIKKPYFKSFKNRDSTTLKLKSKRLLNKRRHKK